MNRLFIGKQIIKKERIQNNKQKSSKLKQNTCSLLTQSLPYRFYFPNQQLPSHKNQMSSHQQQQTQIMQACNKINQMLGIPHQQFSFQALNHIDWYMTVLQIIYPQLESKFDQIKRIENQAIAIDKLLFMLAQEEIIEEDFLQIKGQDIVEGEIQSIYYVVQLLNALIQREVEDAENQDDEEEGEEEDQLGGHNQHADNQRGDNDHHQEDNQNDSNQNDQQEEQYSNDFQQQPQSSHTSPQKPSPFQQPPAHNLPKPSSNDPQIFKNVFNHYDSQDQPSHQEERHSVLGIQNQFQDDDQEDQQQQQEEGLKDIAQAPNSAGKQQFAQNNATFGHKSQGASQDIQPQSSLSLNKHNNQAPLYTSSNQANIFSNPQKQSQLVATGYKMLKKQPQFQKKQFSSSSSEDEAHQYEQPKKKPTKVSKPSQQQTEEEDQNQYFINPTIKKYKSDPKLIKTAGSGSKKSTTKKNLFKYASPTVPSKQAKKLVSHPTIKKQYRKATNPEAKKLTQEVKVQASMILKKRKKPVEASSIVNPAATEMERKTKQLKVKLADWKKDSKIHQKKKLKTSTSQSRSNMDLGKILNWRQGQLKKQKQQFQKAMQLKLQVQKQAYIKKINTLLIKLQKQKQLYQRQQYKQQLINQNQQAAKRLTAIQQWYRDKINMLKQSNTNNNKQRTLMHTGHKEILKQIEKELKRQNQKQIMAMTMKYRRQQAQVENDLEQLQREIIKVYKRN